jgi:branched-subunit amino acid ABC-type transport system permease component
MNTFLNYLVPGLTNGSTYAIIALGLVLTYKTTGVLNFAHGGFAAAGAYLFYQFRVRNDMPWFWAMLIALLIVGIGGGLLMAGLGALLQEAPDVLVVAATVGLLVFLQSLMTAIYGNSTILFNTYLPQKIVFTAGDVRVSYDDLIKIGFAIVSAIVLALVFGKTRIGKETTAVVDDPHLLSLHRVNPFVVQGRAWVLGITFSALAGMFLAPVLGISADTMVLLVIAAYGAAAVGLFKSLPLTIVGAFTIGILVAYLPSQTSGSSRNYINTLPQQIPFIVLFGVFLVTPSRFLQDLGVRTVRPLAPIRQFAPSVNATGIAGLTVFLATAPIWVSEADINQWASGLGYAIVFAALGLLVWTSGQVSLASMAFAAIGAATTGHMLSHGLSWPVAVLIGALVTLPFGIVIAIPSIRLAGVYVAVATFGFGIVIQQVVYPMSAFFGEIQRRVDVPRPVILGVDFTSNNAYYFLALITLGLVLALILAIRRSRLCLLLRAMSSSPTAVEVHGASVTLMKVTVFCISAALFAVGGATIAGVPQSASGTIQGSYNYTVSLVMIAVLTVTGRRPVLSPIVAAVLYQVIRVYPPFDTKTFIDYQGVIFGVAAVVIAILPATDFKKLRTAIGAESRALSNQAGISSQARELRPRAKV